MRKILETVFFEEAIRQVGKEDKENFKVSQSVNVHLGNKESITREIYAC